MVLLFVTIVPLTVMIAGYDVMYTVFHTLRTLLKDKYCYKNTSHLNTCFENAPSTRKLKQVFYNIVINVCGNKFNPIFKA